MSYREVEEGDMEWSEDRGDRGEGVEEDGRFGLGVGEEHMVYGGGSGEEDEGVEIWDVGR